MVHDLFSGHDALIDTTTPRPCSEINSSPPAAYRATRTPRLVLASQQRSSRGSACPAVIERLVRAAHPCSNACCQRGEGNLRVSRATRLPPHGTRDRRRATASSAAQGPNCGLCAGPMWLIALWEACRRFCRAPSLHINETVLLPGEAVVIYLLPAAVRAFSFCVAWYFWHLQV